MAILLGSFLQVLGSQILASFSTAFLSFPLSILSVYSGRTVRNGSVPSCWDQGFVSLSFEQTLKAFASFGGWCILSDAVFEQSTDLFPLGFQLLLGCTGLFVYERKFKRGEEWTRNVVGLMKRR